MSLLKILFPTEAPPEPVGARVVSFGIRDREPVAQSRQFTDPDAARRQKVWAAKRRTERSKSK